MNHRERARRCIGSLDAIEQALAAVERETLEQAAKAMESRGSWSRANDIRALGSIQDVQPGSVAPTKVDAREECQPGATTQTVEQAAMENCIACNNSLSPQHFCTTFMAGAKWQREQVAPTVSNSNTNGPVSDVSKLVSKDTNSSSALTTPADTHATALREILTTLDKHSSGCGRIFGPPFAPTVDEHGCNCGTSRNPILKIAREALKARPDSDVAELERDLAAVCEENAALQQTTLSALRLRDSMAAMLKRARDCIDAVQSYGSCKDVLKEIDAALLSSDDTAKGDK